MFVYVMFPIGLSLLAFLQNKKLMYLSSSLFMTVLTLLSIYLFSSHEIIAIHLNETIKNIIIALDVILLLYFAYIGKRENSTKIMLLALLQLVLYLYCETHLSAFNSSDIIIDKLAALMLIIINLVGSSVVIYAYKYIEHEKASKYKKVFFISYLWFFIAVMNLVVMANNLLLFFFFFELTTLSSYLLIRFREDEISLKNALLALWINQLGGVFLLIAISMSLHSGLPIYFSDIISGKNDIQIMIIFLAFAAFVKGATIPFESWLLGAMVAPTPVSAILHSATMVKIAPFLILRLAPSFSEATSIIISIYAAFVFFAAILKALAKDNFKEILAYSTIAMLALMISIAAIGTPQSQSIVLYLIFFHALSKAILFMCAGILEKTYAIKSIDAFENLISKAPKLSILILLSFASLALPPFGLFFAKVFSIQYLSTLVNANFAYIFVLIFLILGSSLMVLLYFKVTSLILVAKKSDRVHQGTSLEFLLSSYFLFAVMLFGIVIIIAPNLNTIVYAILALLTLILFFILLRKLKFAKIDHATEYYCGEKDKQQIGNFYFDFADTKKAIYIVSFLFLISLIASGVL
ncbi:MAG: proton-conducting transporter membrane subunit [Sulfurospirillaceae bacterium]|nr:proton-conducting transporter membrane subunit [Sulfurospirillaceae bacterium]